MLALVVGVGYVARGPRIAEQDPQEQAARTAPAPAEELIAGDSPAAPVAAAPAPAAPAPTARPQSDPTQPSPAQSATLGRLADSSRAGQRENAGLGASGERREIAKVAAPADSIVAPPAVQATSSLGAAAARETEARRLREMDLPGSVAATSARGVAAPVAAPAPALAEQSAQLRPRQVIDREPSAGAAADALTERTIPGCWRTRTTARSDSILVSPRILSVVRDSLVIVLSSVRLDTRALTVEAPPRATVLQLGTSTLRGTARTAAGVAVPFEATRVSCP